METILIPVTTELRMVHFDLLAKGEMIARQDAQKQLAILVVSLSLIAIGGVIYCYQQNLAKNRE